jgi:hypothetical protein
VDLDVMTSNVDLDPASYSWIIPSYAISDAFTLNFVNSKLLIAN